MMEDPPVGASGGEKAYTVASTLYSNSTALMLKLPWVFLISTDV